MSTNCNPPQPLNGLGGFLAAKKFEGKILEGTVKAQTVSCVNDFATQIKNYSNMVTDMIINPTELIYS